VNKRAMSVGLLVACALHLWILWPAIRPAPAPTVAAEAMPPIDSVAVRELPDEDTVKPEPEPQQPPSQAEPTRAEKVAAERREPAPAPPAQPAPPIEVTRAEPQSQSPPPAVQLAQAQAVQLPPAPAAPSQTQFAPTQAPKIETTPDVPDSGPAQLFAPIAAREAVVESAPVTDDPMPTADAWPSSPVPSAVAALREPEPPPLPPTPAMPQLPTPPTPRAGPPANTPASEPIELTEQDLAPEQPTMADAPRASPVLRMRSREMRSWNRDSMLSSLPKPDPAFLTATDPRPARRESQAPRSIGTSGAEPRSSPVVELAPRPQVAYAPVRFTSPRDRAATGTPAGPSREPTVATPSRAPAPTRSGGGDAADRGYLKSLGPVPQDPVARIAWGDADAAMRTMSIGRMALVIVDNDLKVVSSIDGSTGEWVRAGLPAQMSTFSNRVRVVDHVSAFAAFARFCQPNEHLAVLVPIGLERRIESAMDRAARSEGLSRRQVAACYGRLEPRHGALDFAIDRVERRQVQ
jgi:hypothetical protein